MLVQCLLSRFQCLIFGARLNVFEMFAYLFDCACDVPCHDSLLCVCVTLSYMPLDQYINPSWCDLRHSPATRRKIGEPTLAQTLRISLGEPPVFDGRP